MVRTPDPPHAAGGQLFYSIPLHRIGTRSPGGYSAAHPVDRAAGSSGVSSSSHRHRPPYRAYLLNRRECYGAYDTPDHRPPPFDGRPPDDRAPGAAGLSASMPPPAHRRAGCGVESPSVVAPPDRHMSGGTSSGRRHRSRRESDISPVPSPIRCTEGERSHEDQHHRARDESSDRRRRSPRFHSPLRGSKSVPLPKRHGWEDERKASKPLPSCKRYRLEDRHKDSSSGRHWYDDGERSGSRCRYGDDRHTQELADPSSYNQVHYLGDSERNFSPGDHVAIAEHHLSLGGKLPSPMSMEISPWDDGYDSPTSPTYRCEDVHQGSQDDDKSETPGWLYSASVTSNGSRILERDLSSENEGLVLKTEKQDSAYNALVDDFMDAVMTSWRDPIVTVDEEAHQKQADRFAELALKRYNKNKNNKVKYALVEAIVSAAILEGSELYGHVNFYAKAKNGPKKNEGKVLVFAELHHIGRRPNAMIPTCFQLLDENNQSCGRFGQVRNFHMIQDLDMGHCYACSARIKHPDGSCYKAGHFVDMLCYS